MKTLLLTGSNGFVGRNIISTLKKTYNVIPVSSQDYDLREQSDTSYLLRDIPNTIVHAAGTVGGIGANKENPGRFFYDNLTMGINIIHQAMLHRVAKFVLLGTVCSYPKITPVPFKEEDLWNGYPEETNAPYGIAKKTLMELLIAYRKQYGFNGINLVPVNMYGPNDHFDLESGHVIPALIRKLHEAKLKDSPSITVWGDGSASREFLYAEDLGNAIELSLQNYNSSDPVNIGTGRETTIKNLVTIVKDIVGFKGNIIYDTSKPNGQPRRCLDTSKAKREFGFEAKTSFEEGLNKTYKWFIEKYG